MGRSRGGLTTKIHALVDAEGRSIARRTQRRRYAGDDPRRNDPACRPTTDERRETLADRGAWANIRPLANRKTKPAFSAYLYRYRNLVERFFNKVKHFRAVATRYDKRADNSSHRSSSRRCEFGCALNEFA